MFRATTREMNIAPLAFVVDLDSLVRSTGKQIDWDLVPARFGRETFAVTVNGTPALGAIAVPVDPLLGDLPAGTVLDFGGATELVRLTAPALKGATSLAVSALIEALEDNDVAYFTPNVGETGSGGKVIPAGTVMCELSSGKVVPRSVRPAAETAIGILETKASTDTYTDSLTGYSVLMGGIFNENMLPDSTGVPAVLPTAYVTELRARGGQYIFRQSRDSRGN